MVKAGWIFCWILFALCLMAGLFGVAAVIFVIGVAPLGFRAGWRDEDRRIHEAASSTVSPAGWYPDAIGCHDLRWWDGGRWTSDVYDQATR